MANFFLDNKDLQFHLQHPLMRKIVALKERNYTLKDHHELAPQNFEDAMDNYRRVLEIAGEVCGEVIAPNAEGVDHEGPRVENDHVVYAEGTARNIDAITKAGLSGMTLPYEYDGLNFPLVCFVVANEMVARGDAGFENIWGLQDCAETLNEFASEELKRMFLPRVSAGETCAMDLTEPDAGSDLGAVMLKATYDEKSGRWLLNGVKRFITNGDGHISLVLARTEEGTSDARGLSMLVHDKRDGGLIKYVMSLMNAARLGIGAQSVGLCEAAYREALKYAQERAQFGKPIIQFAAVAEMLSNMKAKLQGARALLYETTRFVEIYKQYGHIAQERSLEPEERQEMKFYNRLADGFTPLVKLFAAEYANQLAYDAVQIHGGSGFMKDYPCERLYRDARIMNIYEGTSQLQVVAAINAVTKGTFLEQIKTYEAADYAPEMCAVKSKLTDLRVRFEEMVARVETLEKECSGYKDFHARRLVETAGHIIITYLLARQAGESAEYIDSARIYCKLAESKVAEAYNYLMHSDVEDVDLFKKVGQEEAIG